MPNTVERPSPVPLPFSFVVKNGSKGISRGAAVGYEADLKAMRVLVVASGTAAELAGVRDVLAVRATQLDQYHR
jgi:hypothetical protein